MNQHSRLIASLLFSSLSLSAALPVYAETITPISSVQGAGEASPLKGSTVTVQAIVVGDYQGKKEQKGFFIQEESKDTDNNPATSEGLFVYGTSPAVNVGDLVEVTGKVKEYKGLTQLALTSLTVISSDNKLPKPATVNMPFLSASTLERYEGMRITFPQTLTVSGHYGLGRYGEITLSSGGRLKTPTNVVTPGAAAKAMQAKNDLNRITLDDGFSSQNVSPIAFPAPGLSATNTLRNGYTLTDLTGVLSFSYGKYRIFPTSTPAFKVTNARTATPPATHGKLTVASFNVLNYFNGDGKGGDFPTARGAHSRKEFKRQRDKIIAAITAMNADIVGLMEIENDGYGKHSAIQDLVNGLNDRAPNGVSWAFVNPGVKTIGSDVISVGIIYREETVKPVGQSAILDASVNSSFNDRKNRPSLAHTFVEKRSGETLTVAINHLKSKGSPCKNDPNTGDGQGNCNGTRTKAAQALVSWLATDPTRSGDSDFLVIGDMNAYAMEDPITAIKAAGYTDMLDKFQGAANTWSYTFKAQSGYLDHALASKSLVKQITGAAHWHTNADEPHSLDYNMEHKSPAQQQSLYNSSAYRASDHDAVVIGITLK